MSNYIYHTADEAVDSMYRRIRLKRVTQLSPDVIAERLGISLAYLPVKSMRINQSIYLDSRLSKEAQWEQFGHELCHVLWHPDNQLHLTQSFIDMQERQANNFALFVCIPTKMLLDMTMPEERDHAIHRIMRLFNVSRPFAERRLNLHMNKLYQFSS
jgi:Zn-dependent peptidase ImmA (M78 family)